MAEPTKVPDWLVERLVAGDLDAEAATAVRARLANGGELVRLDEIAESNRALLAQHPTAEAVAAITRRLEQVRAKETASESTLRRFWPGLAVALPALAVALIFVFAPKGEQEHVPSVPVAERETVTSKGLSPTLVLYKQVRDGAEVLGTSDRVRAGDVLQVAYISAGRPYGVIASIDALGVVTLHLPEAPGHAARLRSEGATPVPHAFELDGSPGFERFVFATSTRQFATDELVDALARGRLEQLPADFEVTVRTVEKGVAP